VALEKYEEGIQIIKSNGTYDRITKAWVAKALANTKKTSK